MKKQIITKIDFEGKFFRVMYSSEYGVTLFLCKDSQSSESSKSAIKLEYTREEKLVELEQFIAELRDELKKVGK